MINVPCNLTEYTIEKTEDNVHQLRRTKTSRMLDEQMKQETAYNRNIMSSSKQENKDKLN